MAECACGEAGAIFGVITGDLAASCATEVWTMLPFVIVAWCGGIRTVPDEVALFGGDDVKCVKG